MSSSEYLENAEKLFTALFLIKDINEKEKSILSIIPKYDKTGILTLKSYYNAVYSEKDLISDINNQLESNFRDFTSYLFMDPYEYDCITIYNGIYKFGYSKTIIFEILTARPLWYLEKLLITYKKKYNNDLKEILKKEFPDNISNALLTLLKTKRNINGSPDKYTINEKTNKLINTYSLKWINDIKIFTEIFAKSSPEELINIGRGYFKRTGYLLSYIIENEIGGNEGKLLNEILYNICRPCELFAKKLNEALTGLITDKSTINRIIITRNEVDMKSIKILYKYLFNKNLIEDIKDNTSGNYQKLVLEIAKR